MVDHLRGSTRHRCCLASSLCNTYRVHKPLVLDDRSREWSTKPYYCNPYTVYKTLLLDNGSDDVSTRNYCLGTHTKDPQRFVVT